VEKVALSILKVILLKSNTLRFLAHLAKGQVSFCHHLASSVRPPHVVNFHILIFSSETTGPIATNFGGMVLGWPPSKIVSGDPDFQPR
jgi:hypothetical protein